MPGMVEIESINSPMRGRAKPSRFLTGLTPYTIDKGLKISRGTFHAATELILSS
jgi:hypothetical protein